MLMTILFYISVACFALALICWSLSELFHVWQLGLLMSLVFMLGTVALLARLIATAVLGDVIYDAGEMWLIFSFSLALAGLYLHFRLFGTMLLPLSALLLIICEMLRYLGFWQVGVSWIVRNSAAGAATVLTLVALALALACAILALSLCARKGRLARARAAEAELGEMTSDEEFRAHSLRVQFISVTEKMPRLLSHLAWWALALLSFGLGAYVLWCHSLFGIYWAWQPLFGLAAAAWVILFIGKDMLFIRG